MGLKLACAQAVGRLSTWGLKNIFHRPAANFPGKLALYVNPLLISDLLYKLKSGSLVVCGTNGKTTTNNLLADVLEKQGYSVICNREGSNLGSGIATALLQGKQSDWGVFECDELWLAKVFPQLQPNYLVLLNLFRDQLDRCGEIDRIQESIASALVSSPHTVFIYNADDPLCAAIAAKVDNKRIAFGIAEDMSLPQNTVSDAQMCQQCSNMLTYAYRQYGQLGDYRCGHCGFNRGELDFAARNVKLDAKGLFFEIRTQIDFLSLETKERLKQKSGNQSQKAEENSQAVTTVRAPFSGAYMVYNLLAVFTAAHVVGGSEETFQAAIDAFNPQNGRLQQFEIDGRSILMNLAKNPTGFNQNMKIILQDRGPKLVGFFVNDKLADGQDISWIWDVDFEELSAEENMQVFVGGIRKNDLQVRLKYADIPSKLVEGAAYVLEKAKTLPEDYHLYIIANYTALPPVHAELTRLEETSHERI